MELNSQYIGSYIKFMRYRAGLTQYELAERIGVGSKTVSKWEQGRGIPDISLLYSLSLELDVDIESLLAGNLDDIGQEWTGMICTGMVEEPGLGEQEWERLISMFLLVGIREIVVFDTNKGKVDLKPLLYGYRSKGFLRKVDYAETTDELWRCMETVKRRICLLYQPAFLYGMNLTRYMRRAMLGGKTKTLVLRQGRNSFMPGVCFDRHFSCTGLGEITDSEWHMFPMVFGEHNKILGYLEQMQRKRQEGMNHEIFPELPEPISVEVMERGMLAFSFKTRQARILAEQILSGIEESQNIRIGNLEEIMKVRGWK